MIPTSTAEFDAVPTDEIRVRSVEEAQAWLLYSLTVLQRRGLELGRKTSGLMFNPFLYRRWRLSLREWRENTRRMEAILAANNDWALSVRLGTEP